MASITEAAKRDMEYQMRKDPVDLPTVNIAGSVGEIKNYKAKVYLVNGEVVDVDYAAARDCQQGMSLIDDRGKETIIFSQNVLFCILNYQDNE